MAKLSQQNQKGKENASNSISSSNSKVTKNTNSSNGVTKAKRTRRNVPRDSPPQRTSIYRGVTRHRWTGRYEAHLWDKNCWNESQNKKGRQVYLGAYDEEEAAAHAYDLAALKYWGQDTILNFPLATYNQKVLKEMEDQSREEYIGSLRRKSSGFSRGASKYRGVARHHHNGRWEARIGRVFGNKYLYLGTYATQEEAATAYDIAAIEYRGLNAVTNFDLSQYIKCLKPNQSNTNCNTNPTLVHPNNLTIPSSSNPNPNPNHELGLSFFSNHQQQPQRPPPPPPPTYQPCENALNHRQPGTATSALGLLLQSSKFKEMMEMTSMADCPLSPTPTPELDHIDYSQCSFPEEIQTYFKCNDLSRNGEGEDGFFGELNTYMPTMFQCDFDA